MLGHVLREHISNPREQVRSFCFSIFLDVVYYQFLKVVIIKASIFDVCGFESNMMRRNNYL